MKREGSEVLNIVILNADATARVTRDLPRSAPSSSGAIVAASQSSKAR